MARKTNQKGKILYIEKMLQNATESHTVSMQTIISELDKVGITAERKSIYDDMEVLRSFGYDVQFRRGKPGGYYIGGNDRENAQLSFEDLFEEKKEKVSAEAEASVTAAEEAPAFEEKISGCWKFTGSLEKGKQIKLSCDNAVRTEMEELFGKEAIYKEKEDGRFYMAVELQENEQLFGWLTSMGTNVRIVKPKKTALAYRDYLKNLVKEYKGI